MDTSTNHYLMKGNFEKLEKEFRRTIPEKLKTLQGYIDELHSYPREETLIALRLEVHKIAGTSASFGFTEVSQLCKALEQDVIQKIHAFSCNLENPRWVEDLESCLKRIRKAFSNEPSKLGR